MLNLSFNSIFGLSTHFVCFLALNKVCFNLQFYVCV
uniref:Uncharacterized protein n=1 Tax=Rhizophora mucronata TaxID=61149 RepID=A0A2P2R121_RHIMU